MKSVLIAAAALAPAAYAQSGAWGQCGGIGYSGPTTCVAGYSCVRQHDYYSQCLPGSAPPASSSSRTTLTTATRTSTVPNPPSSTVGSPTTTKPPTVTSSSGPIASGNPIAGWNFYANPYYSSEVHSLAIPSFIAQGKTALAAKATAVAKVPSFVWLDTRAKVPSLEPYAKDVQAQNAAGGKVVLPIVVYNFPDRDCSALASAGELDLAKDGLNLYKAYVDSIAAVIKKYSDVKFVVVHEPDGIANLITNMGVPKCQNAAAAYRESTIYGFKALNLPNVHLYADAGHAGWLGWPANLAPAAKEYASLYKQAGSPKAVRGIVTNVSNYNGWSVATCASYTTPNANCDEKKYINAFAPLLEAEGFPAKFLVDTSRSGVQPAPRDQWGDWCNVIGTGFGTRPSTTTDDPLLDAFVWVKPGGEADGTSNTTAVRYDPHCGRASAFKPAPEAGTWFQAYFEQLLTNANPAF